jgi:hypothetical protein
MLANIFLNPELDPQSATPLVPEMMAQIDIMGLEFDGDNPEEQKTWVEIEDVVAEEKDFDPEIDGDEVQLDDLTAKDIRPAPRFTPGLEAIINTLLFKTRKEQVAIYFQAIDWLREKLRQVETRDQLYALVDVASELDAAMMSVNTWNKGWDAYAKLEYCFNSAEQNIKRLEAIAAEQARISEKTKLYWLERSKVDNQRVPA